MEQLISRGRVYICTVYINNMITGLLMKRTTRMMRTQKKGLEKKYRQMVFVQIGYGENAIDKRSKIKGEI